MGKLKLPLLLLLGLFAMRTFWGPDWYDGHDSQAHIVRLWQFDKALKDGQFPPAWAPDLYAGRGYPVFIFAYPLPYFAAEGFHLLGANLAVSLKLVTVLAYLTSIVGMYFLAGFLGAILWGFAPYMFVKIFITGSLGVIVAFAFIPWFFFFLKRAHVLGLSLTAAGWILSHEIKPLVFLPLIGLLAVARPRLIKPLVIGGLLALGLTAWFVVPALYELKFTHFNDFVINEYWKNFVPFPRLLYSKWGTGAPGWSDNPLSQQVGIAQWLAVGLSLIFWRKLWPYLLAFGLSIFLMLNISRPVWDLAPLLPIIHIPWRFLSLAVFSAAWAGGLAVKMIKLKVWRLMVSGLLIGLALYGNRNHLRINEARVYDQEFFDNYTGVATGWNEHLPIWVKTVDYDKPKTELPSNQLNTLYYPGWLVKVDGLEVPIKPSENGLIEFSAPAGDHQIEAKFTDTWWRSLSKIISLLTLAAIAFYYFRHRVNDVVKILLTHVRIKR